MDLITIILTLVLAALPAVILLKDLKKQFYQTRQINLLPGPKSYPIVGTCWEFLTSPVIKFFDIFHERNLEYGPGPYRTWIGKTASVNLLKPEHIELIVNNQKHITKGKNYKTIEPWLGTGLLISTGEKWFKHRKLITPTFHFQILDTFIEVFANKSNELNDLLRTQANGQKFDIYPYITRCALDIICETAMGVQIDAMHKADSEYVRAVYDFSDLAMKRILTPWFHSDLIWYNCASGKMYKKCVEILHGFTNKVIADRKRARLAVGTNVQILDDELLGKKKRLAFLDLLLEASAGGQILTDEEIREEVDTFMFEGHDTTTAAICWTLFLLGNHPEIQEKVHEELDGIFQGSDRPLEKQDLVEMKYLEMVIKETLRMYPSVPFIGRILGEDTSIGGYWIPKGTSILIHVFESQRDPDHFPNPNQFNPENFSKENISKRHPYAYMPFSAGARNCIGQKFAILEEKTVLSTILRNYTIKSLESIEECQKVASLILRPANGVKVTLTPRQFRDD